MKLGEYAKAKMAISDYHLGRGPTRGLAVVSIIETVFGSIAQRISLARGVRCSVSCGDWPNVTVRFAEAAHDLYFQPHKPGQSAFHRMPRFDVSYQRSAGRPRSVSPDQQKLLMDFLGAVSRVSHLLPRAVRLRSPQAREVKKPTAGSSVERIHLLSRCNLRCLFCGTPDIPELSFPQVDRMLRAMRDKHTGDLSSVVLLITGGEPTLSPILPRILRQAGKLGFHDMLVTTNGVRLADASYADTLVEAGLPRLEFSLRSFKEKVYDRITRTKGQFQKAMEGLRNAAARFDVLVNMVVNKHNYTELPEITRFLSGLQAGSRRRMTLMPSIVVIEQLSEGLAARWEPISIPNSKLIPYLAEAVRYDHAQKRRVILRYFDGLCYAPVCAGRDYPELLRHAPRKPVAMPIHYVDDPRRPALPAAGRVKLSSCRDCRYDPVCHGMAPGNAALYGLGELVCMPRARSRSGPAA